MTFTESIQICFRKYADFKGRASKSEFWWWILFVILISMASRMVGDVLHALVSFGTLLPSFAVTSRRLHDIDRSGWWQLMGLIPLIGWAIMTYWCTRDATSQNAHV